MVYWVKPVQIHSLDLDGLCFEQERELWIIYWPLASSRSCKLRLSLSFLCPPLFRLFFCLSHMLTWLLTTESLYNEVRGAGSHLFKWCIEDRGQMKTPVYCNWRLWLRHWTTVTNSASRLYIFTRTAKRTLQFVHLVKSRGGEEIFTTGRNLVESGT